MSAGAIRYSWGPGEPGEFPSRYPTGAYERLNPPWRHIAELTYPDEPAARRAEAGLVRAGWTINSAARQIVSGGAWEILASRKVRHHLEFSIVSRRVGGSP